MSVHEGVYFGINGVCYLNRLPTLGARATIENIFIRKAATNP